MIEDLKQRKIQPRNLTARADHWVRGNPVTTRPDSGVDNCYPGLEFDQRNLDKRFLPGLEFEYHGSAVSTEFETPFPPLLRAIDNNKAGRDLPLVAADLGSTPDDAVFLWAVFGILGAMTGAAPRVERFGEGRGGLNAWRVIHDLEPGPVAVLLARRAAEGGPALTASEQLDAETALQSGGDLIRRDSNGALVFGVLSGMRAAYLVDGMINPDLFEPGDLSRSLCAPWQYDFTDCGCFYWASNKPDLVALEAEGPQIYSWQRAARDGAERPAEDVFADPEGLLTLGGWTSRDPARPNRELNHVEIMNGWERLNPVFDMAEAPGFRPAEAQTLPDADVLSRDEIKKRLRYLATVEHGLMVEYLYAHYSIDAPRALDDNNVSTRTRYDVARSVLSIAIDEMRHFRWVNEILRELGEPIELGRVDTFQDLDNDGRSIEHKFVLKPLTSDQLDWFIEVEKPSSLIDPDKAEDTIDGLYTRILLSIRQSDEFTDVERTRLTHLIKLIIDEGFDHFTRFSNAKRSVDALGGTVIRQGFPENPPALPDGHIAKVAELVADRAYSTVLSTLFIVFSATNQRVGDLLVAARYAMYALDDAAHEVIVRGGAPRFLMPTGPRAGDVAQAEFGEAPRETYDSIVSDAMEAMLNDLRATGADDTAASMERHYDNLRRSMAALL